MLKLQERRKCKGPLLLCIHLIPLKHRLGSARPCRGSQPCGLRPVLLAHSLLLLDLLLQLLAASHATNCQSNSSRCYNRARVSRGPGPRVSPFGSERQQWSRLGAGIAGFWTALVQEGIIAGCRVAAGRALACCVHLNALQEHAPCTAQDVVGGPGEAL